MRALLRTFSWQELRHHPWRNAAAVLAVMLGVALAFSVHLINASALDEFSSAVRSVNGQPDLELRAAQGSFDEALFARVAQHPQVALASPVLERRPRRSLADGARRAAARARRRCAGAAHDRARADAAAGRRTPTASPCSRRTRCSSTPPRASALGEGADAAAAAHRHAQRASCASPAPVAAGGAALAVMDIGAAQDLFGRAGQLTRIDLRLAPGTDRAAFMRSAAQSPGWPAQLQIAEPGDAAERVSNLSRAYRVNLTVLALVALFTGAFLVFSVLALSVAKRAQQFALLGVLGLTPRERLRLVLAESLVLGLVGSVAGIALGTALAALRAAGAGRRPRRRLLRGRGADPALERRRGPALRRLGRAGRGGRRLVAGARGAGAAARRRRSRAWARAHAQARRAHGWPCC